MTQNDADFANWLDCLRQQCQASQHRALVLLQGNEAWAQQLVALALTGHDSVLWLGEGAGLGQASMRLRDGGAVLGMEYQSLVVNCYSGFDADGFGAVCGTLSGGGILLLIVPNDWPCYADPERARLTSALYDEAAVTGRFYQRFLRILTQSPAVYRIDPGAPWPKLPAADSVRASRADTLPPYETEQQRQAVEAICHVVTGHRRRPLVLTADRGRGKSAALGLAAAQLVAEGRRRLWVTAPSKQAAATLLAHVGEAGECVRFISPDELLQQLPAADLVMVDEAAAIPLTLLEQILRHYSRVVFSTTIHGYEGTGRGFALRFRQRLDQITPQWRSLHLTSPIRWAEHDPLERLIFDLLLLNAEPADSNPTHELCEISCQFEWIERGELVHDEQLLHQLFGLLVQAHYRTTPADLRYLLDAPDINIAVIRQQDCVVAVALIAQEGGFDDALAAAIASGQRRPRGHLIAQSLAAHAGLSQAPTLRFGRVVRLAVHPAHQRRGIGSRLIAHLSQSDPARHWDALAVSYSTSPELLRFWHQAGFHPARIGFSRDARSGSHAMMMLLPLTQAGDALVHEARTRMAYQLPDWMLDALSDLDVELIPPLFAQLPTIGSPLTDWERADVQAFAHGQRGVEYSMPMLRRWLLHRLSTDVNTAEEQDLGLLIERLLQLRPWSILAARYGATGKAQLLEKLRQAVSRMLR